jgi:hypothetical protein
MLGVHRVNQTSTRHRQALRLHMVSLSPTDSFVLRAPTLLGLLNEVLHTQPFGVRGEVQSRTAVNREAHKFAVNSRLKTAMRIQILVGGPGFEPGASRSRNLRGLVHRERFRGF